MDGIDSRLKFIIEQKNNPFQTITASITFIQGSHHDIHYITKDVKKLFQFAESFAMKESIPFQRRRRKRNGITTEVVLFEEGETILKQFRRNHQLERKKRNKITKGIIGGSLGVLAGTGILVNVQNKEDNDQNIHVEQLEENSILNSAEDSLESGILKEINKNSAIPSISFEMKDSNEVFQMLENPSDTFSFNYEDRSQDERVENAKENMPIFEKYGRIYGIDPQLLMAIMCQESGGIHQEFSQNGHAIGGMQIEDFWDNRNISAYNFETQSTETVTVHLKDLSQFDYNVKIACMILQDGMVRCHYDIPKGVQCYNFGYYNMQKLGEDWIINRKDSNVGDSEYFEHVFSFLPDGSTLEMTKPEGEKVSITLNNQYSDTYYTSMSY